MGTKENPADLGSRGGQVSEKSILWLNRPWWLPFPESWPADVLTGPTKETQAEARIIRVLPRVTVEADVKDELDQMLSKWSLWKTVWIGSWVARFVRN